MERRVERSELEQLLVSAVDETKRRYLHRRLTSELSLNDARKP